MEGKNVWRVDKPRLEPKRGLSFRWPLWRGGRHLFQAGLVLGLLVPVPSELDAAETSVPKQDATPSLGSASPMVEFNGAEQASQERAELKRRLGDKPLTFATVVTLLDEQHPQLRPYQLKAQGAALKADAARRLPDPLVGVSINEAPVMLDDLPIMLEATQAIPLHGRLALEGQMPVLDREMVRADQQMMRRNLVRDARRAFARYRSAQGSVDAMVPVLTQLKTLETLAQQRYATGQGASLDVLRVQEQLARLENDRIDMVREVAMARANLSMVLGLPPDEALPPVDMAEPLPKIPETSVLMSRLLVEQPELLALDVQQKAARLEQRLAETSRAPELMVRGAYMFSPAGMDMWSLGGMISVPLQSRKTWQPRREAALLEQRAIEGQKQARLVALQSELTMIQLTLKNAWSHVELHDQQLIPLSQRMLGLARIAYESGQGSLREVLEITAALQLHHLEREQYLKNWLDAVADLEMRVGPLGEEGLR